MKPGKLKQIQKLKKGLMLLQTDANMKLLANNSQHCWMLHVASVYTPCCMLLRVVGSCCAKFETGQSSIFEKFLIIKENFSGNIWHIGLLKYS